MSDRQPPSQAERLAKINEMFDSMGAETVDVTPDEPMSVEEAIDAAA